MLLLLLLLTIMPTPRNEAAATRYTRCKGRRTWTAARGSKREELDGRTNIYISRPGTQSTQTELPHATEGGTRACGMADRQERSAAEDDTCVARAGSERAVWRRWESACCWPRIIMLMRALRLSWDACAVAASDQYKHGERGDDEHDDEHRGRPEGQQERGEDGGHEAIVPGST